MDSDLLLEELPCELLLSVLTVSLLPFSLPILEEEPDDLVVLSVFADLSVLYILDLEELLLVLSLSVLEISPLYDREELLLEEVLLSSVLTPSSTLFVFTLVPFPPETIRLGEASRPLVAVVSEPPLRLP